MRPLAGAGLEYQHRWVSDGDPARQLATYFEGGALFRLARIWSAGLVVGVDSAFVGPPGRGWWHARRWPGRRVLGCWSWVGLSASMAPPGNEIAEEKKR